MVWMVRVTPDYCQIQLAFMHRDRDFVSPRETGRA
jgi:hypothetical protein